MDTFVKSVSNRAKTAAQALIKNAGILLGPVVSLGFILWLQKLHLH